MTFPTFTTATGDQHRNPDYYAGRADAYDEHRAGATADTLEDRFEWMTDPTLAQNTSQLLSTAYLHGYRALIEDLRAEQSAVRCYADVQYTAWQAT